MAGSSSARAVAAKAWLPENEPPSLVVAHVPIRVLHMVAAPMHVPHMRASCPSLASGRQVEPEVYPRPDGTVYVCGEPQTTVPLPPSPSLVTVEPQVNRTPGGECL